MHNHLLSGINSLIPSSPSDELLFEQIFHHSPTAYILTDPLGLIHNVNEASCILSGYSKEELLGTFIQHYISSNDQEQSHNDMWDQLIQSDNNGSKVWKQHKNGEKIFQEIIVTKLNASFFLITHTTVSNEITQMEHFRYLAYHDPLTGLANRFLIEDRLTHAIDNAARLGTKLCVLFCDLNEFKLLNDELGHLIGDNTLQEISKRLTTFFRSNDTVGRYGGDEFVIIVENLQDEDNLDSLVQRLDKYIREPLLSGITISASIGVACFPMDGTSSEHLLNMADTKMYNHKNRFYGLDG